MTYYYALFSESLGWTYNVHRSATKKNALAGLRKELINSSADAGMLFDSPPPTQLTRTPKSLIGVVNDRVKYCIYMERVKGKNINSWPEYRLMADGTLVKI